MTALNNAGTVAVDREYNWIPIDENTPRGVKLQLIDIHAGVAVYGTLPTSGFHWSHYCPLPTFEKPDSK